MKFLIDTGASASFINPEFTARLKIESSPPIKISTILGSHQLDKKVSTPIFKEFQENGTMTFLIFKFHNYFDGLIGLDILTKLHAKIDLSNKTLVTRNSSIPLLFKPNLSSGKYTIFANTKTIVKIPVDYQNGDVFIKQTLIKPNLTISEGIYSAKEWYCPVEICNSSTNDQTLLIEQPLKVNPYSSSQFIEMNNFNFNCDITEKSPEITKQISISHLNKEEKQGLLKICKKFEDLFFQDGQNLTFTNKIKHEIRTTDDIPIYTKTYRYPYCHKEEVRQQVDKMLKQGIIRQSYSPWSAPVWVVPKKKDSSGKQKWRLVIDYRKLNEKTVSDKYPIPNINEILDKLGKCNYFSTLDLASGFHQIEMDPKSIAKTAFSVDAGHYEYLRMPFGLKNAPSTFQRVMDNILKDLVGKCCLVYLDDIIIYSTSLQEHLESLEKVLTKLKESNLKIQIDKSDFLRKEIAFLGHIVSTDGVKPNPDKIQAIQKFPIPKTQKDIKSFLGLLGYYRKFIKDFAKLVKPLTVCLKKDNKIELTEEYIKTFETCKDILTNDPILQYPDFSKPFNLTTDASNFAIGAVLSQGPIGSDRPICYASRTLSSSETNYSTIEKELLAIVWATKYFRPYLFGRKFKIITDHKPLTWIMNLKDTNSKLTRWRLKLEEYDYEIVHKKGTANTNADALSRIKINHPANIQTIDVNANDTFSVHGTSGSTVHSALEDLNDGIPIAERPLNEFSLQTILEKSDKGSPMTLETIFKNKQRRTIREPDFTEDTITDIFKKFLSPNKLNAIYTNDDIFRIVQSVYSKYFSANKTFKIVRCKQLLTDVRTADEQENLIKNYHNSFNHRGIDETLLHIKRKYYFPYLKTKITETINNCDKCQLLKYDRNPQKVVFEKPETPSKPLDILHIDIYTINNKTILTILDKFSKFAAAYTLQSRTSILVVKSIKQYISLHGIPSKIVCDQGTEFTSNIFKDLCKKYNINLHITSFQQTSSNSPVERLHSTLTEIYRIILATLKEKKTQIDHDEILFDTIFTYNNAIHSATKYTPFELFYGRPYTFTQNISCNEEHDYITKITKFQEDFFPKIKKHLENTTSKRIDKLNTFRNKPEERNSNELIFRKECRRNKLTPRFSKHRVKNNNKVTIITAENKKVHKSRIKKKKKYT